MKKLLAIGITAAALAGAGCASPGSRAQSRSILVEPPAALPAAARNGGSDLFLHDTTHGQTLLYIESADGRSLSILDVTDPARIAALAEVPTHAAAPFYYVKDVNQLKALVRIGNIPGYAMLDFSSSQSPSLIQTAALVGATRAEPIGDGALLVSGSRPATAPMAQRATQQYAVLDTSHAGPPALIADIPGVKRSVEKADTGTTFLLADDGVTVIRDLHAEMAYAIHQAAERQ